MTKLDRVFVSRPVYDTVRVVDSVVKSDHKAVVVCNAHAQVNCVKRRDKIVYLAKHQTSTLLF